MLLFLGLECLLFVIVYGKFSLYFKIFFEKCLILEYLKLC